MSQIHLDYLPGSHDPANFGEMTDAERAALHAELEATRSRPAPAPDPIAEQPCAGYRAARRGLARDPRASPAWTEGYDRAAVETVKQVIAALRAGMSGDKTLRHPPMPVPAAHITAILIRKAFDMGREIAAKKVA